MLVSVRIRDSTVARPYSNISEELKPLKTISTADMDWKKWKRGSRKHSRRGCLCLFFFMMHGRIEEEGALMGDSQKNDTER